jgi:hypothetical protein
MVKMEWILLVDFTPTQAQAKELAPPICRGEAQDEAAIAKSPSTPPPLPADGVDRMYHQLAEIHTITVMQLAKCAHWCWSWKELTKARCDTIRDKIGTITLYRSLIPGPAMAAVGTMR